MLGRTPRICLNVRQNTVLVYCAKLRNVPSAPIGHLNEDSKGKLVKPIFSLLNADATISKCSFKLKGQVVNVNDRDRMQVLCKLKNRLQIYGGPADFVTSLIKEQDIL